MGEQTYISIVSALLYRHLILFHCIRCSNVLWGYLDRDIFSCLAHPLDTSTQEKSFISNNLTSHFYTFYAAKNRGYVWKIKKEKIKTNCDPDRTREGRDLCQQITVCL